jgi:hypothetical protein
VSSLAVEVCIPSSAQELHFDLMAAALQMSQYDGVKSHAQVDPCKSRVVEAGCSPASAQEFYFDPIAARLQMSQYGGVQAHAKV